MLRFTITIVIIAFTLMLNILRLQKKLNMGKASMSKIAIVKNGLKYFFISKSIVIKKIKSKIHSINFLYNFYSFL
jgi:hypothetical protein